MRRGSGDEGLRSFSPAAWTYAAAVGLVVLTLALFAFSGSSGAPPARGAGSSLPAAASEATGIASAATPTVEASAPAPVPPGSFDPKRALQHVREFAERIGLRAGGTEGEDRAIEYARTQLEAYGYDVKVLAVPIPNGRTSHDVIATRRGTSGPIVVIGGHIDTKAPSPGADDNGSGCGTVLELARDFAMASSPAELRFVLFGNEELIGDGDPNHHHFGSRAYAKSLTADEKARFAGMISVDMVGYGPDFRVRSMGVGPRDLCDQLLAIAKRTGAPLAYVRDPGSSGWSDHEPFERAGLPAAWLEWGDDGAIHTKRDTTGRLAEDKIVATGTLVRTWLQGLTAEGLKKLEAAR